jgi:hypothetical protein
MLLKDRDALDVGEQKLILVAVQGSLDDSSSTRISRLPECIRDIVLNGCIST